MAGVGQGCLEVEVLEDSGGEVRSSPRYLTSVRNFRSTPATHTQLGKARLLIRVEASVDQRQQYVIDIVLELRIG